VSWRCWTAVDALGLGIPIQRLGSRPYVMATIWRGGCIARARFLNRIRDAYAAGGDVATEQGVAIPAFSSSLSYYDGGYGSLRVTSLG
jgi:6-phosphogluconate dehydrogenase